MANPEQLERLRTHVTGTVKHATKLLADLTTLDEVFEALVPSLADLTDDEREAAVARLCGYDAELPERLRTLVESLADVLAGLTTADGGRAWIAHQVGRLAEGEDAA